ncbi:hypothetical protein [Sphingobium chungbukense]|uniref:Uncharacterized protein n=1 Tax=Sphingobium chungbukense TaxID=56193 RepID=A0A0M3AQU4_9SPHN|nr:hypothetical protein [Sphingobium chungbukense]KKW92273.1 hypothetical protein YP76_10100 [Sphingobium chungbukense]
MTVETKRAYSADETQAYERYISAVANHNIVCARAGATTREKMDAAFAADAAYREFCRTAGLVIGQATRPSTGNDVVKRLEREMCTLTETVRTAYSMIHAANGMGVIENRPADIDQWDHDVCVCLFTDAQTVLRRALERADSL